MFIFLSVLSSFSLPSHLKATISFRSMLDKTKQPKTNKNLVRGLIVIVFSSVSVWIVATNLANMRTKRQLGIRYVNMSLVSQLAATTQNKINTVIVTVEHYFQGEEAYMAEKSQYSWWEKFYGRKLMFERDKKSHKMITYKNRYIMPGTPWCTVDSWKRTWNHLKLPFLTPQITRNLHFSQLYRVVLQKCHENSQHLVFRVKKTFAVLARARQLQPIWHSWKPTP